MIPCRFDISGRCRRIQLMLAVCLQQSVESPTLLAAVTKLPSIQAGRLLVRQPPAAPAPQALSPEPAPVPELAIVSTLRAKCSCRVWATRSVPSGLSSEVAGSNSRLRASGCCRVGAEHGLKQCLCLLHLEWPGLLTCVVALSPLGPGVGPVIWVAPRFLLGWSPESEIDEAGDGSQLQPVGR
jgi:hypothetical protein